MIIFLNACGSNQQKREPDYRQAQTMPELQVPDDLKKPTEHRSMMDVPEKLDTGEIPDDLEQPPTVGGINLEDDEQKTKVASEDEEEAVESKKELQSEIVFNSDNTQMLKVKGDIDTVWPRVASAVKKIGFTIDDSNRGKFYYSISREFERVQTMQDPSKPVEMGLETPTEKHLIYVEPGEAHIEITVRNLKSETEGTVLANQILQQIKGNIEKP
ncbi:MAG: outer membrane protein assembly factor BamC [Gammaproteobacteria bacterium]